ncbi:hypothetical protein [Halomonas casei]|uniref:hypothetical protein n=1 Tax=Halomonas TaxID=2745 RepID=UPI0039F05CB6
MSLNTRLLFALLGLPLLVYAIMAVLLVVQNDAQTHTMKKERLENAVELITPSLSEAIADADLEQLENLARQLLSLNGLRTVAVFNEQGSRLLLLGKSAPVPLSPPADQQLIIDDDRWRLRIPLTTFNASDLNILGWLDVEMEIRALTLERYKLIASLSLGGMLLGLLLFLIAFAISR